MVIQSLEMASTRLRIMIFCHSGEGGVNMSQSGLRQTRARHPPKADACTMGARWSEGCLALKEDRVSMWALKGQIRQANSEMEIQEITAIDV